jgi:ABC-type phosphate transport system substrate-binding protein
MKKILSVFLLMAALLLTVCQAHAQAIIIANPSVKASEVSAADLRDIFTGSANSLKDGSRVTPVLLKGGAAHEEFLRTFIGKSDAVFRAGWRSLVFSGQASMPRNLDSDAAMVEYVAHNASAIGYISKTSPHEGVKVLSVR